MDRRRDSEGRASGAGPLRGVRIVEIAGLGAAPFCGMMLADHGAEVIRVDRPGAPTPAQDPTGAILERNRRSIAIDLKHPQGAAVVRDLCRTADGLIEGFRPGVMERLGLGPDVLLGDNPRLVFGRMTGWGQTGPYAGAAGHDINYIAVAGALHAFGRAGDKPTPPINLVGDFGGGGLLLAFGMVSAILSARTTGQGQVIDCAMTEGAALLMTMVWGMIGQGAWRDERGVNLLDGGAHFYDSYECADGRYVSVGAIEPAFHAELRRLAGLADDPDFDRQMDPAAWPPLKEKMAAVFKSKTRDEWCALMAGSDTCVAPVMSLTEAPTHPQNATRGTFAEVGGVVQPMPAPRFSGTPTAAPTPPARAGADGKAILSELGYDAAKIANLAESGIVAL